MCSKENASLSYIWHLDKCGQAWPQARAPLYSEPKICGKAAEGCWPRPAKRKRWWESSKGTDTETAASCYSRGCCGRSVFQIHFLQRSRNSRSCKTNCSVTEQRVGEILASKTDHKQEDAKGRGRCGKDFSFQAAVPFKGSSLPRRGLCCEAYLRVLRGFSLQGARGHRAFRSLRMICWTPEP